MHKCIAVLHIMEPFFAQEGYQKSRKRGLEDGNYEVIVCSWLPESGIRGKHQQIDFYFNQTAELPRLRYEGVPTLL